MAVRIDLSERLFNLTCALLVTRSGLTKQEIFSNVQGYKELHSPDGDNSALNRMFERDKVLLTESGILWRAFIPKAAMEDNQEYRYLIATEDFVWPKGTALTSRQVALLNLAARAWAKASLSADANRAIFRIKAIGDTASENLVGIAPRIKTYDPAFAPITTAIESGLKVSFDYRKGGAEFTETRTVEPWSLQNISGQWLLVAFDTERNQVRNFLLKRIVSEVEVTEQGFEQPTKSQIELAIKDLNELTEKQVASFGVIPDSAAWFHFHYAINANRVQLRYMDQYLLAEELLPFAPDIFEIQPQSLKELIDQALEKIASDHA